MKKLILALSILTVFACTTVVSGQLFKPSKPLKSILVTETTETTETTDQTITIIEQRTKCGCVPLRCTCAILKCAGCGLDNTVQIIRGRPLRRLLRQIQEDQPVQRVRGGLRNLLGLEPDIIIVESITEEQES